MSTPGMRDMTSKIGLHTFALGLIFTLGACDVSDPGLTGRPVAAQPPPAKPVAAAPKVEPAPQPAQPATELPPPPPSPKPVSPKPLPPPPPPPPPPKPVAKPPPPPPPKPKPVRKFPREGVAAVAYEDLKPRTGDEDFNDFMTDFKIVEKGEDGHLTKIVLDFYPRTVGGSYDHAFIVVLNGVKDQPSELTAQTTPLFKGGADVTLIHFDPSGREINRQSNLPVNHDVVIFPSTHAVFTPQSLNQVINTYADRPYIPANQSARLEIVLHNPELNEVKSDDIDLSRYRMVLHVKKVPHKDKKTRRITYTTHDIDIVDIDPSNPDNFDKAAGYPWGFIIPANWRWPVEGMDIVQAYPKFHFYQQYLLGRAIAPDMKVSDDVLQWYNFPGETNKLYPSQPLPPLLPEPQ